MAGMTDLHALRKGLALQLASGYVGMACRMPHRAIHRPVMAMSVQFPSPLGIAAGFDREGRLGRRVAVLLRDQQHRLNQAGKQRVPLVAKLRCVPGQIPFALAALLLELGFDGLLTQEKGRL
ncbi:hypothetical protein [Stutzerimonas stutzeri]|uniref:hypothetical protein n=1 Tax=Stutzerimonas stutzeri TaxID=316 RepID=UPI001C2E0FF7|nr:hypothetical protein [Stutzerimonas stutzeri]